MGPALEEIDSNGVYVKGVNAIDPEGKVGVLLMARSTGGSIGLTVKKQKEKKIQNDHTGGVREENYSSPGKSDEGCDGGEEGARGSM